MFIAALLMVAQSGNDPYVSHLMVNKIQYSISIFSISI